MALEQIANDAATTLASSVNGSSNPVSVSVTDASKFPTVGNFRILIDTEILLVTAVSGTTFTCSRAQESTTIASHSAGAAVTHILTVGSFRKLLADYNISDTFSNRPTAGVAGRLFVPTDFYGVRYRDNGTTWDLIVDGAGPLTAPDMSVYTTWANQEDATLSQLQDFWRFKDPGGTSSGEDWRLKYRTTTATGTITMISCIRMLSHGRGTAQVYGHFFRRSSDGKYIFSGINHRSTDQFMGRTSLYVMTNFNTFSTSDKEDNMYLPFGEKVWIKSKFTFSSSTYEMWWSLNGTDYVKVYTQVDTSANTVNQIGFCINNYTPDANDPSMIVDIYAHSVAET